MSEPKLTEREAYRLLRLAGRLLTYGTLAGPDVVIPVTFVEELKKRDLAALREINEAVGKFGTGRGPTEGTLDGVLDALIRVDPILSAVKKLADTYGWSEVETLMVMVLQLHAVHRKEQEQTVHLLERSSVPYGTLPDILKILGGSHGGKIERTPS